MSSTKLNPQDFGITIKGMVSGSNPTKTGSFIIAVAMGDSMVKVLAKENGLSFGQPYHALCNPSDKGNFFFEKCRITVKA